MSDMLINTLSGDAASEISNLVQTQIDNWNNDPANASDQIPTWVAPMAGGVVIQMILSSGSYPNFNMLINLSRMPGVL